MVTMVEKGIRYGIYNITYWYENESNGYLKKKIKTKNHHF